MTSREAVEKSARDALACLVLKGAGVGREFPRKGESLEKAEARLLIFELKFQEDRDLRRDPWPAVIAKAVHRNDHAFFVNLGKVLGTRPRPEHERWVELDKLDQFLVLHWTHPPRPGIPTLAELTWKALATVCACFLKNSNLSPESVRIRAIRLGLKPYSSSKLAVAGTEPHLHFRKVYKRA